MRSHEPAQPLAPERHSEAARWFTGHGKGCVTCRWGIRARGKLIFPPPRQISFSAIDSLSKDLENVQMSITNYKENNSELIQDFARLKLDVRDQFKNISIEMKNLESDVKDLKDLVTATFELIVDQRYKDGLESIEAAYETFLDGTNNLDATLLSFDYYIVELQTNFNQHLKPEKIEEYLRIIKNHKGAEMCHQMFN